MKTSSIQLKTLLLPLLLVLGPASCVRAQTYTLYAMGNPEDVVTQPSGGVCLMGGRTENDEAMRWFLRRASGGDVVVLRASGSDGYNDYFYTELGVSINSVRSFVFHTGAAAGAGEVLQAVEGAEAIWFAGGDQANYVDYWRGTPLDSLLRVAINERDVAVGGTSAGMAILGGHYFTAANGSISSAEALANPLDARITVDSNRFLAVPGLENVLTDTHFSERDRYGRFTTFLARASAVADVRPFLGIACDEYAAVCLDPAGTAAVFGTPGEGDFAYFVRTSCDGTAAEFAPNTPLNWGTESAPALIVARVAGNDVSPPTFDLPAFRTRAGSWQWQNWWVTNGSFNASTSPAIICPPNSVGGVIPEASLRVFPNPTNDYLSVVTDWPVYAARIVTAGGQTVKKVSVGGATTFHLSVTGLAAGNYYLIVTGRGKRARQRFVVS